ncbi:MAG: DUF4864 domain-containing protein [Bythopirellula sp.]|nr:DUF4864 domain-containing protein [Bythopirellula sp.]
MSGQPATSDVASRGGLGVVAVVFFSLAFFLTLGVQFLATQLGPSAPASEPVVETPAKDLIQPQADFAPEKVVALQLAGLADGEKSGGIQQCFVFASPGNKEMTGPLSRFAAMVQQPPYDALVHRQLVLIGKPIIEDGVATVMVTVLDSHDEIRVFQFVLSKQQGEAVENCWMTDAVYPLQQLTAPSPVNPPTVWRRAVERGVHG